MMKLNIYFILVSFLCCYNRIECYSQEDEIKNSVDFTFDFYRQLLDQSKNTVVSPLSLRVLLSSLYQRSFGDTEEELKNVVKFGKKSEILQAQSDDLKHITQDSNIVNLVNKVYLKRPGVVNDGFKTILDSLKTAIELVSFANGSAVAARMNKWVEKQTKGLIKNLVPTDAVKPHNSLFLINTLYFKAHWLHPFSNSSTYTSTFKNYNGGEQEIEMMSQFGEVNIANSKILRARILELPYTKKSNIVYWAILPNTGVSIKDVADNLNYTIVNNIKTNFNKRRASISIPKHEIEFDVDGKNILENLGLKAIFKNNELNLLKQQPSLNVDQIKQKSKIIVNTDGTEAASGSFVSVEPRTFFHSFIINRPFIYMILTADTREPIYIGHFSNVTQKD